MEYLSSEYQRQTDKKQADAMSRNGLKEVGYKYINIDDGYFGGRDASGE